MNPAVSGRPASDSIMTVRTAAAPGPLARKATSRYPMCEMEEYARRRFRFACRRARRFPTNIDATAIAEKRIISAAYLCTSTIVKYRRSRANTAPLLAVATNAAAGAGAARG
jgi:hypothetical protein